MGRGSAVAANPSQPTPEASTRGVESETADVISGGFDLRPRPLGEPREDGENRENRITG